MVELCEWEFGKTHPIASADDDDPSSVDTRARMALIAEPDLRPAELYSFQGRGRASKFKFCSSQSTHPDRDDGDEHGAQRARPAGLFERSDAERPAHCGRGTLPRL